jgi:uncharacterized membrane protein
MTEFFVALGLFLVGHSVPPRAPVKAAIQGLIGQRGYRTAYSVLSTALLAWLIIAAIRAPYLEIWIPAPWTAWVTITVMIVVCVAAVPAFAQPNPLSITLSRRDFDPENPGIVAISRHPVLWTFALWAGSHIPPNGDVVSLILFGLLGAFAFAGMAIFERRKRRQLGSETWDSLAAATSIIPFAAIAAGRARFPTDRGTITKAAFGLAGYFAILHLAHRWIIGADPLALSGL